MVIHERMWKQWLFFKLNQKVNDPKMTFDPTSVEVTCVTLPKDFLSKSYENMSKYVDTVTLFFSSKTWTTGHRSLDDLRPQVCWGHMCDSTQGSLCPSPMGIHQCMLIQWSILQSTTCIPRTHTTYRMSDHIVSFWTKFRRDKKCK